MHSYLPLTYYEDLIQIFLGTQPPLFTAQLNRQEKTQVSEKVAREGRWEGKETSAFFSFHRLLKKSVSIL